jgi:hypothetical protein
MSGEMAELGHVCILDMRQITPSPGNDLIYRPASEDDPDLQALARSIAQRGVLEPLVLTLDHVILSGHRRYAAARLAGQREVPCRIESIYSFDDDFPARLVEYNKQRSKTLDEKWREEIVAADPEDSYRNLVEHRTQRAAVNAECITIEGHKSRANISQAKTPFLNAIAKVINSLKDFWPLSVRQIHYQLLNDPPLRHASKPDSIYRNDKASYKSLVDLVARARVVGTIPFEVIGDETRPVVVGDTHTGTAPFMRRELDWFLKGYRRNLQQSQPNHIEIVGEKNTVQGILKPIAEEYCIPLTSGRGFCSLPPRYEMMQRLQASGKDKLVLLVVSDFDPEGEVICHSFARSMRNDFKIRNIHLIKVALTLEQGVRFNLPQDLEAKPSSTNYKKFVAKYGTAVSELEALPPRILQSELRAAIDSVMDCAAYNAEIEAEKTDAAYLDRARRNIHRAALVEAQRSDATP